MMFFQMYSWAAIVSMLCLWSKELMEIWILMEINILLTSSILSMEKSSFSMEYYSIQSSCSILLMSMIMMSTFCHMKNFFPMMTMIIFMKMGMFPFFAWINMYSNKMSWNFIFLMTTIQKIPPICFLMFMEYNWNMTILLINNFILLVMMNMYFSTKKLILMTSLVNISWIISSFKNMFFFFAYFFLYSMNLLNLTKSLKKNKMISLKSKYKEMTIVISCLSIMGIPPLSMFFMKWFLLKTNMENQSMMNSIVLLISTSIISLMYIKPMMISLISFKMVKKSKEILMVMNMNFLLPMMMMI